MRETTGCTNWQREQPKSAKLVVAAAKAAQRELGGYGMATSQPCTMLDQHCVLMAISRLARRSVQHSQARATNADTSTASKHTQFAAATPTEGWHECREQPEPTTVFVGTATNQELTERWHDCNQQSWSASQISDHHQYPQLTNSEIHKKKQQAAAQQCHAVKATLHIAAALDKEMEANTAQTTAPDTTGEEQAPGGDSTEEDAPELLSDSSSGDDRSGEEDTPTSVVAGVSRDRREAKKRRIKPVNTMIEMIKEARKPNRQHKATAARMLTKLVDSNRVMQAVRQKMTQIRAKR